MIEVPSSVWIMDQLAPELDFVSVGTNDLTQYLLAVDRDNPLVAKLYEPTHPAVLRALNHVAEAAHQGGIPCSVCGDIAGDYALALILVGMGYESLSLAPNFLPEIRLAIRKTTLAEAQASASQALQASNTEGVGKVLDSVRDRLHASLGGEQDPAESASRTDS